MTREQRMGEIERKIKICKETLLLLYNGRIAFCEIIDKYRELGIQEPRERLIRDIISSVTKTINGELNKLKIEIQKI